MSEDYPDYLQQDPSLNPDDVSNIDPSFLEENPLKKLAKKTNERNDKNQKAQDYFNELYSKEVKRDPKQRAEEYFQDMIKSKFGFKPDNTGKKVAAHAIDTIVSMLPIIGPIMGFNQAKASNQGSRDYTEATRAYKDLSNVGINGERADITNANNQFTQLLKQQQLATNKDQFSQTFEQKKTVDASKMRIADILAGQGQQKIDLLKKQQEAKVNLDKAIIDQKEAQTRGLNYNQDQIEAWDNEHPHMTWNTLTKFKGEALDAHLAKYGSEQDLNDLLNFTNALTKAKTKDTGSSGQKYLNIPEYKLGPGNVPVPTGQATSIPVPGGKTAAPAYVPNSYRKATPGNALEQAVQDKTLGGLDFMAQVEKKPIAQGSPAYQLRQQMMQPQNGPKDFSAAPPITDDPLSDAEIHANNLFKNPLREDQIKGSIKGIAKSGENFNTWNSLNTRQASLYDNAAGDYAKGSLNWQGGWAKLSLPEFARTVMGKSEAEINNETNASMLGLEHLRKRSGGRVNQQTLEQFQKVLHDKMDSPEGMLRRLATQKMMIEMGTLGDTDSERYNKLMDRLNAAYDKNPVRGGTLAESINDYIDWSIRETKRTGKVVRPSLEKAVGLALYRLKNGTKQETPGEKLMRESKENNAGNNNQD